MLAYTELVGEIPEKFLESEEFSELFYNRASRIESEMPDMYERVRNASKGMLRVEGYPGEDSFTVYVCPVKVDKDGESDHPILLTFCTWGDNQQMLYWPMDMIPLTDEERHDIWYNFVQDDEFYYPMGYRSSY